MSRTMLKTRIAVWVVGWRSKKNLPRNRSTNKFTSERDEFGRANIENIYFFLLVIFLLYVATATLLHTELSSGQ